VKAYANAGFFRASNASGLEWSRQPGNAKPNAFLSDRKIQLVEALQDTGRCCFSHSKFLDIDTTLGYPSRFLPRGWAVWNAGGVAQLGERLNGIQEVRGSIPLTSMAQ
jgi:hypothetical protein